MLLVPRIFKKSVVVPETFFFLPDTVKIKYSWFPKYWVKAQNKDQRGHKEKKMIFKLNCALSAASIVLFT